MSGGEKLQMGCPRCSSSKVVRNGHHHQGKTQFLCTTCHKFFYKDPSKGYPPTNIPFPVIAYLLYFRKKMPQLSNMRRFRRFASQWLKCLVIRDSDVSRQIIHHWIKNYEKNLESIISFQEAKNYCKNILTQKVKEIPKEVILSRSVPHTEVLKLLEETYGKSFCVDLSHKDREFFAELCDIVAKFPVYCSKLLDKNLMRRETRLFFERAKKM
jgi:hypothetical protein